MVSVFVFLLVVLEREIGEVIGTVIGTVVGRVWISYRDSYCLFSWRVRDSYRDSYWDSS